MSFDTDDEWGTPVSPSDSAACPDWVQTDYVRIVATGHGIEHLTINKAGDASFTRTFTGDATLTAYSPTNVITDGQGDVIALVDNPTVDHVVTGTYSESVDSTTNKQNSVFHLTITSSGVDELGNPVAVHATQQVVWTPSTPQDGPPHLVSVNGHC